LSWVGIQAGWLKEANFTCIANFCLIVIYAFPAICDLIVIMSLWSVTMY